MGSLGRVLLIDDQPSIREAHRLLAAKGFDVTSASTGREAVQRAHSDRFDVVVMDMSMRDMDGVTFLRRLRGRRPDVPVIVMSEEPSNEAVRLGAFCLVKPVDAKALEEAAVSAVRLHRSDESFPALPLRHRASDGRVSSVTATDAKNEFGRVLETALRTGLVVITKHDAPKAVLLSIDEYRALQNPETRRLDTLRAEFDALLDRMQTRKGRAGMRAAFDATPRQLGKAAVAATRRRD
jgi:prevent-host-death family protein